MLLVVRRKNLTLADRLRVAGPEQMFELLEESLFANIDGGRQANVALDRSRGDGLVRSPDYVACLDACQALPLENRIAVAEPWARRADAERRLAAADLLASHMDSLAGAQASDMEVFRTELDDRLDEADRVRACETLSGLARDADRRVALAALAALGRLASLPTATPYIEYVGKSLRERPDPELREKFEAACVGANAPGWTPATKAENGAAWASHAAKFAGVGAAGLIGAAAAGVMAQPAATPAELSHGEPETAALHGAPASAPNADEDVLETKEIRSFFERPAPPLSDPPDDDHSGEDAARPVEIADLAGGASATALQVHRPLDDTVEQERLAAHAPVVDEIDDSANSMDLDQAFGKDSFEATNHDGVQLDEQGHAEIGDERRVADHQADAISWRDKVEDVGDLDEIADDEAVEADAHENGDDRDDALRAEVADRDASRDDESAVIVDADEEVHGEEHRPLFARHEHTGVSDEPESSTQDVDDGEYSRAEDGEHRDQAKDELAEMFQSLNADAFSTMKTEVEAHQSADLDDMIAAGALPGEDQPVDAAIETPPADDNSRRKAEAAGLLSENLTEELRDKSIEELLDFSALAIRYQPHTSEASERIFEELGQRVPDEIIATLMDWVRLRGLEDENNMAVAYMILGEEGVEAIRQGITDDAAVASANAAIEMDFDPPPRRVVVEPPEPQVTPEATAPVADHASPQPVVVRPDEAGRARRAAIVALDGQGDDAAVVEAIIEELDSEAGAIEKFCLDPDHEFFALVARVARRRFLPNLNRWQRQFEKHGEDDCILKAIAACKAPSTPV